MNFDENQSNSFLLKNPFIHQGKEKGSKEGDKLLLIKMSILAGIHF